MLLWNQESIIFTKCNDFTRNFSSFVNACFVGGVVSFWMVFSLWATIPCADNLYTQHAALHFLWQNLTHFSLYELSIFILWAPCSLFLYAHSTSLIKTKQNLDWFLRFNVRIQMTPCVFCLHSNQTCIKQFSNVVFILESKINANNPFGTTISCFPSVFSGYKPFQLIKSNYRNLGDLSFWQTIHGKSN